MPSPRWTALHRGLDEVGRPGYARPGNAEPSSASRQPIQFPKGRLNVKTIRLDREYEAFARRYSTTAAAILSKIPPQARDRCKKAFSEEGTCYLLHERIRRHQSQTVVETGTFLGLSALLMAQALRDNHRDTGRPGKVYSISQDSHYRVPAPLRIAADVAKELGLGEYIALLEGSSVVASLMETADSVATEELAGYLSSRIVAEGRESLLHRLVSALGIVDLVYLDSLHYEAFLMSEIMAVLAKLGKGSLFVDDVLRVRRGRELRRILGDFARCRLDARSIGNYVRTGCGVYHLPWVLHAFDDDRHARLTVFKVQGRFLRAAEIRLNPTYEPLCVRWSNWHSPMALDEVLRRYGYH
jgi:hypothetical protein